MSCIIAGIGGDSSYMKSCSIECLAFFYKNMFENLTPSLIIETMELVLLCIKEKSREVLCSVIKFLKAIVKKSECKNLESKLDIIIEAIFEWDSSNAKAIWNKLKTLISQLIKKFVNLKGIC